MVSMVASKDTVKEAWEVIKIMCVDDDRVRVSTT
jgi:hypothetical protein